MSIKLKQKDLESAQIYIEKLLLEKEITCVYEKDIPYGRQYKITAGKTTAKFRIYHSKKGVSADLSPIRDTALKADITHLLDEHADVSQIIRKLSGVALIGSDESGKGDYFGPLTVAAVYADEKLQAVLHELSIKDSKKLTDKKIAEISRTIRTSCVHSIVSIYPEKYNSLYDSFRNLNSLLSWAHSRAIANVCEKTQCRDVLIDRFSATGEIEKYLKKNVGVVSIHSETSAEQNIVVAAASILARDAFCYGINRLEKQYSCSLPKGANPSVEAAAAAFVKKHGCNELSKIAKLHFKTTQKIIG